MRSNKNTLCQDMMAGAALGYGFGVLVERVPGVTSIIGPAPRLVGLALGSLVGCCFRQVLAEVQEEKMGRRALA